MNKRVFIILSILHLLGFGQAASQEAYAINSTVESGIAEGHRQVRSILGDDIGKMVFDTPELTALRSYLYNSLLTTGSNSYSKGSYSERSGKILFCPDGTFVQILSGMISLDAEGASAYSGGTDSNDIMPGIWEVSMADGIYFILFYSTHPSMLEDSPTGFLPLPIRDFQQDILLLYGEDHYRRQVVNDCNY